MFDFIFMGAAVAEAIAKANAEKQWLDRMPPAEREEAVKRIAARHAEEQRQDEHAELIEAVKPHNLWSFLGLGSK